MKDIINQNINYVLQDQEGLRWYFTLSENKKIMYTRGKDNQWSDYEYIDSPNIKDFSATMDNKGIVRVVAYTESKQLLYYELQDGQWDPRTLERVYSRFQNITYFSIHSSELGTHILCYIGNSLNKSAELLIHYYLYEGKWYGGRLWRFMSDQQTKPQAVSIDSENKLHLLFTQNSRQSTHLYYSVYDPATFLWEEPIIIYSHSPSDQYQLYVDRFGNVHSIWAESIDGQYGIKYLSKSIEDSSQDWNEIVVYRSPNKLQSPTLLDSNALHCFWKEEDLLYKMISNDSGVTWSVPETISDNSENDITLINYTSFINNKANAWTLWSEKYPYIKLLGIDWVGKEPLLLSRNEYYVGTESTDWSKMQRELSSIKRDNSGLKNSINNLSSQVEQLHSIVYNLQEQMQINEKALFNINARIRQLDFQSNQTRPRQANHNFIPSTNEQKESNNPRTKFYVKPDIKEADRIKTNAQDVPSDKAYKKEAKYTAPANISPKDEAKLNSSIDIPSKEQERAAAPIDTPSRSKEEVIPAMNIPPVEESKYSEGQRISNPKNLPKRVIIPVVEDDLPEKEIEAEKISMGDTTILINPEDPEDY